MLFWVTDVLFPCWSWSFGSTALNVMGRIMYLVDKSWFLKKLVYERMAHVSSWNLTWLFVRFFYLPRSSDEQVTDGAQKLVFVMYSGDTQGVCTSEVMLKCGTEEPIDLGT
jgi:hypothetical protein